MILVRPIDGVIKIVISFLNVSTARPVELVLQSDDRSNARGQILLGTRTVGWVSREYKTLSSTPRTSSSGVRSR